jgi:hypothetical protein
LYDPDEIAVILRQLKKEVRSRHARDQMGHATAVTTALAQVEATSWVNPHQPIAWPHWPKGLLPKMIALAQKVIRRLMCWYISPIVEEQNQFNAAVAAALIVLAEENMRLRADLQALATNASDRVLD